MKLLITGANGFLGRYVVAEALRQGHDVRAVVRPTSQPIAPPWPETDRLQIARADLRTREGLCDIVHGVDHVIHLAAAKSGDFSAQHEGTIRTTENLLAAMTEAGVCRLTAISSFSVYDFSQASSTSPLDESSPIEMNGSRRDVYAQIKLAQEQLIRDYSSKHGFSLVVIRPGMIWGRDNLLNAWVGMAAGKRIWIQTGSRAIVPATYVENCAQAIVLASASPAALGQTFNVVDDDLPNQKDFLREALRCSSSKFIVFPMSYRLLRVAARAIEGVNTTLLRGRAHVPGILIPSRLDARARPLTYSNRKIRETLGWKPQYSLSEGFQRGNSG